MSLAVLSGIMSGIRFASYTYKMIVISCLQVRRLMFDMIDGQKFNIDYRT